MPEKSFVNVNVWENTCVRSLACRHPEGIFDPATVGNQNAKIIAGGQKVFLFRGCPFLVGSKGYQEGTHNLGGGGSES